MTTRPVTCQSCGKTFEVLPTRLRKDSRYKPKYCTSRCYGNARTLTEEERKLRKSKRNRENYLRRKKAGKRGFVNRNSNLLVFREPDYS